ncbi:uncharacterized protein B0I36DRAFT_358153 [Microdochium trichocladiopsis]|uniref:Uncharacterized protein n=1 Tax=Microdochium trichocladiopsis TaxID=1682393 RepID=A0A9P8YI46_9PEZI|nr:uncharacterized protein B0I36DRAFT_358153 [Microdochium trichocladiopsis]KAH7040926.1 hypothetical protein B0I36DRAFT_358153 [Microdochium trichocladiopsis]
MAPLPELPQPTTRFSIHDLEDEEFFSAPQTRHTSIDPVKATLQNPDHAKPHHEPLVPVCEVSHPLADTTGTASADSWRQRFTTPWSHKHESAHDHLPFKVLRRLLKGDRARRDSAHDTIDPLGQTQFEGASFLDVTCPLHQVPHAPSSNSAETTSAAGTQPEKSFRKDQAVGTMTSSPSAIEYTDDENAEVIVERIRDYLATRRYPYTTMMGDACLRNENTPPKDTRSGPWGDQRELYLVNVTDVAIILEIVITGMSNLSNAKNGLAFGKRLRGCDSGPSAGPLALLFGQRRVERGEQGGPSFTTVGATNEGPEEEADLTSERQHQVATGSKVLNVLRRYSFLPMIDQTPESLRQAALAPKNSDQVPMRSHGSDRPSSQDLLQEILDNAFQSLKAQNRVCRKHQG